MYLSDEDQRQTWAKWLIVLSRLVCIFVYQPLGGKSNTLGMRRAPEFMLNEIDIDSFWRQQKACTVET